MVSRAHVLALTTLWLAGCSGDPGVSPARAPGLLQASPAQAAPAEPSTSRSAPEPELAPEPPYEAPAAGAVELRAGAAFTCLLRAGRVRCWGSNRFGQLGVASLATGRGAFSARPVEVAGLEDVRDLALGSFHACALLGSGRVRCWGHGGFGQLGDGRHEDRAVPVEVAGLERVTALAAGEGHSCAVADQRVLCWGSGVRGQLGDGSFEDRLAPTEVARLGGLAGVVALGAGRAHSCALLASGAVWCWGEDVDGELGRGEVTLPAGASPTPAPVVALEAIHVLRVGWGHACAIDAAGAARCWGHADAFQLGDRRGGEQASVSATPVLADVEQVRDVAVGAIHSCFALGSGRVKCLGAGYHGQLGAGGQAPHRRAVEVAGLGHVVAVVAGESHSCALRESGEVVCWGNPHSGRVGPHADERARRQSSPVRVIAPTLAGAEAAAQDAQAP